MPKTAKILHFGGSTTPPAHNPLCPTPSPRSPINNSTQHNRHITPTSSQKTHKHTSHATSNHPTPPNHFTQHPKRASPTSSPNRLFYSPATQHHSESQHNHPASNQSHNPQPKHHIPSQKPKPHNTATTPSNSPKIGEKILCFTWNSFSIRSRFT